MIASGSGTKPSAALSNQTVITQGGAGPDEFRTAPLWGVGQRVFFLHDGRTNNLVEAIEAHKSHGSEANSVIDRFKGLTAAEQQDLINFRRSL